MIRPKSIVDFERCFLGALAIGVLMAIFGWETMRAQVAAQPNSALLPDWFMPLVLVISWTINLLLWFFIARRGSNVAKWIWTVLVVIGALGLIPRMLQGTFTPGLLGVVTVVVVVLNLVATWMLFRPDARAWFAGRPTDLSDTFS